MAGGQKRPALRSRALDVLLGASVAALLIGAAIFGEPGPVHQQTRPVVFGSVQGGLSHAVRRCQHKLAPVCVKGHCAPLPAVRCGH